MGFLVKTNLIRSALSSLVLDFKEEESLKPFKLAIGECVVLYRI